MIKVLQTTTCKNFNGVTRLDSMLVTDGNIKRIVRKGDILIRTEKGFKKLNIEIEDGSKYKIEDIIQIGDEHIGKDYL